LRDLEPWAPPPIRYDSSGAIEHADEVEAERAASEQLERDRVSFVSPSSSPGSHACR
jgi:hypothetical protein